MDRWRTACSGAIKSTGVTASMQSYRLHNQRMEEIAIQERKKRSLLYAVWRRKTLCLMIFPAIIPSSMVRSFSESPMHSTSSGR